ncbi:MAG: type II secretion system protein [Candidatus Omnitrophota bacterium]
MKKGFTLVEILVAVVIVATLATIAIPRMLKGRQKISQRQAESYLRSIRVSQKMYYARFAQYACQTVACSGASAVKSTLGTVMRDGSYTFSVLASGANSFVATANGGALGTITIDESGNFQKDATPYTPPS